MVVKILKLLFALPLILVMGIIAIINIKLADQPDMSISKGDTIQIELLSELRGLKKSLSQNADIEMQRIYPEGYVFLNAVYALAWCSFLQDENHRQYFREGHEEVNKGWAKINSAAGRSPFSPDLSLPYGSFYNGWSSYVLASKLSIEPAGTRKAQEIQVFKLRCDTIAGALQRRTFPPSYFGGAWPADVMLCVASLSVHDKIFTPRYKDVIKNWVKEVKNRLDVHGMIPHSVHPANGKPRAHARGSSMALMLVFLRDIDSTFAEAQFGLFYKNFVDDKFGLTGIREYPKGERGSEDIDSGPVVMGFGGAATIVGMQTLSLFGEHNSGLRIRSAVEAMAFPVAKADGKKYLFGMLPIADAFITWSHTKMKLPGQQPSFIEFQFYSFLIFALLALLFWKIVS